MDTLPEDVARPLSAWEAQDGRLFVSGLREAEPYVEALVNESGELLDPPRALSEPGEQLYSDVQDFDPTLQPELVSEADACGGVDGERTVQVVRQAPSRKHLPDQEVSTIELVKKDGAYALLLDGVQQPPVATGVDGRTRHWLPRFRETWRPKVTGAAAGDGEASAMTQKLLAHCRKLYPEAVHVRTEAVEHAEWFAVVYLALPDGKDDLEYLLQHVSGGGWAHAEHLPDAGMIAVPMSRRSVRTVQPVLVSMRVEDYEVPPERCVVTVLQRVVQDGVVVMRDTEVKSETVVPYSTGDTTASVAVLPYPLIATPPPHFVVNDYSKLMHLEILAQLAAGEGFLFSMWKSIRAATRAVWDDGLSGAQKVAVSATRSAAGMAKRKVAWMATLPIWMLLYPFAHAGDLAKGISSFLAFESSEGDGYISKLKRRMENGASMALMAQIAALLRKTKLVGPQTENWLSLAIAKVAGASTEAVKNTAAILGAYAALQNVWNYFASEETAGDTSSAGASGASEPSVDEEMEKNAQELLQYMTQQSWKALVGLFSAMAAKGVNAGGTVQGIAALLGVGAESIRESVSGGESVLLAASGAISYAFTWNGYMLLSNYMDVVKGFVKFGMSPEQSAVSEEQKQSFYRAHAAQSMKPPDRNLITLRELPAVLRRIAETRASGSLVNGTDQTVGHNAHDLENVHGWHKEAALLRWLTSGEGERNKDADPITGLFPREAALAHTARLSKSPENTPATGNTIDRSGMDPVTLSNTRTQFVFVISVLEQDGSAGPTFELEATRMNGIDAGWIACGHEDDLEECRRAIDCLEERLTALTSVGTWIVGQSSVVADSTDGTLVGSVHDTELNRRLGKLIDDREGPAVTQELVQKAMQRAGIRKDKAQEKLDRARKVLTDERIERSTQFQDRKRELDKIASSRKKSMREFANNPVRLQKDIDKYDRQERTVTKKYAKKLAKSWEAVSEANSKTTDAGLSLKSAERVLKTAGMQRQLANVFDYVKVMQRLREGIMGDSYADRSFEVASDRVEKAAAAAQQARDVWWWSRWNTSASRRNGLSTDVGSSLYAAGENAGKHLGTESLSSVHPMSFRFMEMFTPSDSQMTRQDKAELMRFSAFSVPHASLWAGHYDVAEMLPPLVRSLPQAVVPCSSMSNTFGHVSMLQPLDPPQSALQKRQQARASTVQARLALRRGTELVGDFRTIRVCAGRRHLAQAYALGVAAPRLEDAFPHEVRPELRPVDLMAAAFSPDAVSVRDSLIYAQAGGAVHAARLALVSGTNPAGAARVLATAGVPADLGGLAGLALFAEAVTLAVLARGTRAAGGEGLQLQRVELHESALSAARRAALSVATFVKNTYGSANSGRRARVRSEDLAFHCLPAGPLLRLALERLGALPPRGSGASAPLPRWGRADATLADSFAAALNKIARSPQVEMRSLPFTCVQSVLGEVPRAVARVHGFEDAITAHVSAGSESFRRLRACMVPLLQAKALTPRVALSVFVDSVCSRPVMLKARRADPALFADIAEGAHRRLPQEGWVCPNRATDLDALRARFARLRVDVHPESLGGLAEYQLSSGEAAVRELPDEVALDAVSSFAPEATRRALRDLSTEMNRLDIRRLDSVVSPPRSATYVVPPGLVGFGSPSDVAHPSFETHPVWVEALLEAARLLSWPAPSNTDVRLRAAKHTERGRPSDPFAVGAEALDSGTYEVSVSLHEDRHADERYSHDERDLRSSALGLSQLVDEINMDGPAARASGRLTQAYRTTMHNAERVFQACVLVASAAHTRPDADTSVVSLDPPPRTSLLRLAACVCIANALSAVETGSGVRVALNTDRKGDLRAAAELVKGVCGSLKKNGVAAAPFSEICMCVACVRNPAVG